ncbi:MAG: thioredoxin family protein [Ignavibacteria bacterium]
MKTKLIITIIFLLVTPFTFAQPSFQFDEGLKIASSSHKKVLINIYEESNTWCKKMDEVYSNETIKSLIAANFVYVRLNSQGSEKYNYAGKEMTAAELSRFFGVTGFPTHVFLTSKGEVIKFKYNSDFHSNFAGFLDVVDFEKLLKYFINDQYKDTDLSKIF